MFIPDVLFHEAPPLGCEPWAGEYGVIAPTLMTDLMLQCVHGFVAVPPLIIMLQAATWCHLAIFSYIPRLVATLPFAYLGFSELHRRGRHNWAGEGNPTSQLSVHTTEIVMATSIRSLLWRGRATIMLAGGSCRR